MANPDQRIVLKLHGSKARHGVELDGLEAFIQHLRRALREFERAESERGDEVGRSGQPDRRSRIATGFRLVHFEIGSGKAAFEPSELPITTGRLDMPDVEPVSSHNLRRLFEATQSGHGLSPEVIQSLDSARKALGDEGRFGVKFPSEEEVGYYLDANAIGRLQAASSVDEDTSSMTVSGRLHLIEVEQPGRVEIRATDGVNWACTYEESLKAAVLGLVESLVQSRGIGRRTAYNRGSMELQEIEPLPTFEQTPLFTQERVSTARLERQQGITRPQGLAALQDSEWVDDEASRRYLSLVLDES